MNQGLRKARILGGNESLQKERPRAWTVRRLTGKRPALRIGMLDLHCIFMTSGATPANRSARRISDEKRCAFTRAQAVLSASCTIEG
jgi:hypothetical protein